MLNQWGLTDQGLLPFFKGKSVFSNNHKMFRCQTFYLTHQITQQDSTTSSEEESGADRCAPLRNAKINVALYLENCGGGGCPSGTGKSTVQQTKSLSCVRTKIALFCPLQCTRRERPQRHGDPRESEIWKQAPSSA